MSDPIVEPVVVEPVAAEPVATPTPTDINPTPAPSASDYAGLIGGLPDEMGNHSALTRYSSVEELAKSHINAQSLIGKKAEEYWTSDEPADVARRREIMGIPADSAGYELTKPESLPENIPYDEAQVDVFAAFALENNLSKDQAQKLMEFDAQRAISMADRMATANEQFRDDKIAELRRDWGKDFDYNDSKVTQIADYLGISDVLIETGLAFEPAVQKALLEKIGPAINDDKLIESNSSETFATSQDALDDLETRMLKMDKHDPEYPALVKQRTEILSKIG